MIQIRKAKTNDAEQIHELLTYWGKKDFLLPRSLNEIFGSIRDFCVYEKNNNVIGCSALHIVNKELGEIRSLAVEENSHNQGIGKKLMEFMFNEAKEIGITTLFALTYKDDFFKKLGFSRIDKESLPQKIWKDCINCIKFPNCNEIAMIRVVSP